MYHLEPQIYPRVFGIFVKVSEHWNFCKSMKLVVIHSFEQNSDQAADTISHILWLHRKSNW